MKNKIDKLITVVGMVVLILVGGSFFARSSFHFEITSHFYVYYLIISLLFFVSFMILKKKIKSVIFAFCFAYLSLCVGNWYIPDVTSELVTDPTEVKVLLSNVYTANSGYSTLLNLIQRESPDLIVLQEINKTWTKELSPLKNEYEYSKVIPREDNFGIALFSRYPFIDVAQVTLGGTGVPSIIAEIKIKNKVLNFLATHPLPPVSKRYAYDRNLQLNEVAILVENWNYPVIVAGDLNITMWSPYYKDLIRKTGLKNTRRGYGVLPTWRLLSTLIQLPIDHILVSPSVYVNEIRVLDDIGSDHRPIVVELGI